jgi:oligopeptide/dipeptide ABC transporter ATP-binding protein
LPEKRVDSYPHELSGGMRQRVMIAMALSCQPKLLIADEPTTALDPTIQAQILELISNLQKKRNMSVIFITHDLGVVAETCDRVMVMYAGKVVEQADVKTLFNNPAHPYTQGLMRAVPRLNAKRERLFTIEGIVPHLANLPEGCAFAPRCPQAGDMCRQMRPVLEEVGEGHYVSCFAARKGVAENV